MLTKWPGGMIILQCKYGSQKSSWTKQETRLSLTNHVTHLCSTVVWLMSYKHAAPALVIVMTLVVFRSNYMGINRRYQKLGDCWAIPPGMGHGWPPKNAAITMPNLVVQCQRVWAQVGDIPKIGTHWSPAGCDGPAWPLTNKPLPTSVTMSNLTAVGPKIRMYKWRSARKWANVPPFKVTQGLRNWHVMIGYLWLPIDIWQQP